MDYSFGKEYKLCRKKLIGKIFEEGNIVKKYPFLMHYRLTEEPLEKRFQITISAPKRNFKKAVQRNRIKRLMREVCRNEKQPLEDLLAQQGKYLTLFWVYTSSEEMEYEILKEKFKKLIDKLIENIK